VTPVDQSSSGRGGAAPPYPLPSETPLFTVADLESLGHAELGVGASVRLPGASTGRVVAPAVVPGSEAVWWLVKLSGRGSRIVRVRGDQLRVLS